MKITAVIIATLSAFALGTNAWIDEVAQEAYHEIRLASEAPQQGEPLNVTHLRTWMAQNFEKLLHEASESSHPKGDQPSNGVLRAELKPGFTEHPAVGSNSEAKADKSQRDTKLQGYQFACKEGACEKKDPIAFKVIPFDSPRAIKGSLD